MNLYFVGTDECGVLVAHHTAREAKRLAYEAAQDFNDCDFIDIHVQLMREVVLPPEIVEPAIYESCNEAPWTCLAWRYHDGCSTCITGDLCGKVDEDAD
jgi:hypothetical protein